MWLRLVPLFLAAATAPAAAGKYEGPATAAVERVVDGDTVRVRVGVWIDQELSVSVRVAGVDAPELFRSKCEDEKAKARLAKSFVEDFLEGGRATLTNIKRGKYAGRVVARIEADGRDLGDALIAAGLAVRETRGAWCAVGG
ncbi:MAG: thermonuclease family protein [Pseudomonadota bacterium]